MGWGSRAREANEQLKVGRYRVRRWTEFMWSVPSPDSGKTQREALEAARKARQQHLESIASIIQRRLWDMVPRAEPRCAAVRADDVPQLMFELNVEALDADDARKRAMRHIARALSAKLPGGAGRKVALSPPWGRVEVEELKAQVHALR